MQWRQYLGSGLAFWALAAPAWAQVSPPTHPEQSETSAVPVESAGHPTYTCAETLRISFGIHPDPYKREWTPLCFGTFLSEGWCDPFIGPPNGPGGSLRQGWIGVPDAFFNRMIVGVYNTTRGANGNPNEQVGAAIYETPITRRYMFGVVVPFVDNLQGPGRTSATTFGDVTIENRFLLHETADLTVSLNLNVRVPTGGSSTGNSRTVLDPYLAFYKDLWCGWSVRGAAGALVPVDNVAGQRDPTLTLSLAIGQTITPHDVPLVGDFTYYVSTNYQQDLGNGSNAFVSFTPGIRTHLGKDFYFLAGIEVPVTDPVPFHNRFTFVLVKGF